MTSFRLSPFIVLSSIICGFSAILPLFAQTAEADKGVDIFINACRVHAENERLYHSARFTCNTAVSPYENDFFQENILISGNSFDKIWIRSERIFAETSVYYRRTKESTVILQRDGVESGLTSVSWEPGAGQATIERMAFDIPKVFHFGRIRGKHADAAMSLLAVKPKSKDRYDFSQEAIDFFYQYVADSKKEFGLSLYKLTGTEQYDGQSIANIIECRDKNNTLLQRYYIDSSRGSICPLVQIFNEQNGNLVEEYRASQFFCESISGLWFPEHYAVTLYDHMGKNIIKKQVYRIIPNSFQINTKIADQEFSVDIPEGRHVVKADNTFTAVYHAFEKGTLSLADGDFDLKQMQWLECITDDEVPMIQQEGGFFYLRIVSVTVGILLILLWLYCVNRKGGTRTRISMLLIFVLFAAGCSCESSQPAIEFSPMILDFGNIRPADSPLTADFIIKNNTKQRNYYQV